MLTVVPGGGCGHESEKGGSSSLIDEIVREGARRMLAEALQVEVQAYIARFAEERDENGHPLVVRNGHHQVAGAQLMLTATMTATATTSPTHGRVAAAFRTTANAGELAVRHA